MKLYRYGLFFDNINAMGASRLKNPCVQKPHKLYTTTSTWKLEGPFISSSHLLEKDGRGLAKTTKCAEKAKDLVRSAAGIHSEMNVPDLTKVGEGEVEGGVDVDKIDF